MGITLSAETLEVDEGDDAAYTVRLATQPTAQVTIAVTGQSGTDLTVGPTALTFTTTNWATVQTVTVAAAEDDDGVDDTATLAHTASGGDYAGETASLAVTTADDDPVGITLSAATLGVDEGDDGTYTVRLATQPTAQVTIAVTGHSGTDLTVGPTALTFTTTNWATVQTVTVAAAEDDDGVDDTATLAHTASGGDYAGETASLAVTTADDDPVGITLSAETLEVDEGDDGTYTVRLATQPTAQVTIAVTGHSGTDLTVGPTALTFTTTNWATVQTVTVAAAEDDDGVDDTATLAHTASGGDYAGETASLAVTTADDDPVGITLSAETLEVDEGDDGTYTVRLATQPTAQVTIAVTGHSGTDLTVGPTALTFTTTNWATVQTVTVAAAEDDDGADDTATLAHTAAGGDYAGETASLAVTTADDDPVGITLSAETLEVDEGDDAAYTVRLATQPTAQVTIAVTGQSGTDLTVGPTALTFTTTNWATVQTVTVAAAEDDDGVDDTATLAHTASGGDYAGETASLAVTTADDDPVGITLSAATLGVDEGDDAAYTVRLATQPTAQVTIAVTGQSGTDLTVGPTALTFTTTNWATVQTVTVAAAEDDDGVDDTATLAHTASGGDYAGETASLTVTTADDDPVGITLSAETLEVDEGDDGTYTVRLATQPTAQVTIAVTGHSGTDLTVGPTALTFTTTNWATVQTVTVAAAEDDDGVDDTATLAHTASGGDYAGETASLAVTTTDDDPVGITLSAATLEVDEGDDGTYTVRLATQPTAQVTIAVTGHSGTDLTVGPTALTFTTTNWATVQTVTVAAAEDDDGADDTATLAHTAAGGDYAGETASLAVTTTDDDPVGITLSAATLGVAEGNDAAYTVRLATQPTAQVTIAVTGHSGTDLTVGPTALTFTTTNWATVQTVTVAAAEDDDGADDTATLAHTASGGDYAGETASLAVTTADDDPVGITLSAATLGVAEGDDAAYTVRLATQPTAQVTIAVTGHSGTDLTVGPTALTFTTTNWATVQTVTVAAAEDDDGADDTATLAHTAAGGDYAGETASLTVTTVDDETVGLVLSTKTLGVDEGDDGTYTVRLATQPTAQVTIAVTGHSGTDLTVGPTSLTFTTTNWATVQTVTVAAAEDDDGADDTATLAHTASGGDYAGETESLTVTTADDDPVGITLSAETLEVDEGDDGTYTVRLATQPTAQVTIAVTGHSGTDLTVGPTALTFTTTNWATVQTVTVAAAEDDDGADDAATLAHTASGGDYAGETASLTVTTVDDETVGLVLSTKTLGVDEGDDGTYTVRLATQPTAQVTIAVTGQSGTDLTVGPTALTFTTTNWATVQTVTVAAAEDDDGANESATLTHSASGGDYGSVTASLSVTVTDNDTRGLVLTPASLTVVEGASATYTVKLVTRPSDAVTVTVGGTADTDLTVTGGTLTFSTSAWNDVQTVTVAAAEDEDGASDAATLTHTAAGGDYGSVTANLPVTVTDNDSRGLVLAPTSLTIVEGASATYTVRLVTQPSDAVTVTVGGTTDTDLTVTGGTLTFSTSAWNDVQTVTVAAAEDEDGANDAATLTHTAAGGDYGSVTASLAVTVTDNDTRGLVLAPTSLTIVEGTSATYTVKLATRPSDAVTVTVGGTTDTDLTVTGGTLTFSTSAWSAAQTVTVAAAEDEDGANDAATLTHTAAGGDYGSVAASLAVTVTDNDTRGLVLAPTSLTIVEEASATYTVKLATRPSDAVTVTVGGTTDTDLTVTGGTLTFSTSAWNDVQTVTVAAAEDEDGANDAATLTHTAAGGDYGSVTASLAVTVTDNDTRGLVLAPTSLTVVEEASATYTVKLATRPSDAVTVTVGGTTDTDLTVTGGTLTFSTTAWSVAQTVTVAAAEDEDGANDAATLTHTAAGGDYGSVTASLAVTVTDNDTRGLVLAPTSLTIVEGASTTYTVRLVTQPSDAVTVTVGGTADTDLTVTGGTLTFSTSAWNVAQTVTVAAAEDEDGANDAATLTHTASGGDYGSVTASLDVTVTDDDAALVLAPATLEVAEGNTAAYTVRLAALPSGAVTVTVAGFDGTDLTLDPTGTLTFTTTTWSAAQTLTVTAAEDEDGTDESATLTHTAAGGDYGSVTADLPVTVTDNDTRGLVLAPASLTVVEDTSATYTVKLATRPSDAVTVTVGGTTDTDLTVTGGTLTFSTTTWSAAQTVTVAAAEDEDGANDAATLTHTAAGGDYGSVTASLAVTITDNDTRGLVLAPTSLTIVEGASATYTVQLVTQPSDAVTVTVGATTDTDLTVTGGTLTFSTTAWSVAQTVTVEAAEDADSDDESANLTHAASGGGYDPVTKDLPVTVTDNDTRGLVLAPTSLTIVEGASATYTVQLVTQPSDAVTVTVGETADTDLTVTGGTLTFSTTTWETPRTVTVAAAEDADSDDDGATLTHTASGGGYESVTKDLPVTVTDDDTGSPDLLLSPEALSIVEGASGSYTVRLATEPSGAVTVRVTGTAGTDLSVVTGESLTFGITSWEIAQTVTIEAAADEDNTPDTATLLHEAVGGGYDAVTRELRITVTEPETVEREMSIVDRSANEDAGAMTFTVSMTIPAREEVVYEYATADETAKSGSDYTTTTGSLTILPGEIEAGFEVPILDDGVPEATESFKVTLRPATPGAADVMTARGTIWDDDEAPVPLVRIGDSRAPERSPVLSFEVTLSVSTSVPVTVDWGTAPGTAGPGADYRESSGSLTILPGRTGGSIAVPILDDALDEVDETFEVQLYGALNAEVDVDLAVGTIEDDDGPVVGVRDAGAEESERFLHFTVSLSAPSPQRVTAAVATVDQTATAGADYRETERTVVFEPGVVERRISVPVMDDTLDEIDETLLLQIGAVQDGTSGKSGVGTIRDDDIAPSLTIPDLRRGEADGEFAFVARLSEPSGRRVAIAYVTADVTASEGDDYRSTAQVLVLEPGEVSGVIRVPVMDDALDEADEEFVVQLEQAQNVVLSKPLAIGTIVDDDEAPGLSIHDARARERDGAMRFPVTLDAVSGREVAVDWVTGPGTADADVDYRTSAGRVTIAPGEVRAEITVPIEDDAEDEMDETFMVGLGNPETVRIVGRAATGTIEDDDDDAPVARAWMARFGRTVATQVVDAVEERLSKGSGGGSNINIGMQRLYGGVGPVVVRREGFNSEWIERTAQAYGFEVPDHRQVMARTSFQVASSPETGEGGWTMWGRGATTHLNGDDPSVRLGGQILSGIVGVDHRWGRVLAGLALSHSFGDADFDESPTDGRPQRSGAVGASVSGLNPYLRVRVNDRIAVWGLAGVGRGEMGLNASGNGGKLTLGMEAIGARARLFTRGGFDLALKTDGFRMRSEWRGLVGGLPLETGASRSRVLVEGSHRRDFRQGGTLTPSLQVGMRYDGGDAETGAGLELESSLRYDHRDWGLTAEANGQALLLHAASSYREWGYGASVRVDPGSSGTGLSLRLNSLQGTAAPGAQRLWSPDDAGFGSLGFGGAGFGAAGLEPSGLDSFGLGAGRLDTEVGYGWSTRWDGVLTPYAGWALANGSSRTYRLGGRLQLGLRFQLQLEGDRSEPRDQAPHYRLTLRGSLR